MNALQGCEPPQLTGDATSCSILPGILLGIEAISEYTPIQREARKEFRAYLEQKEREQSADERAQRKLNVAELVKQSADSNDDEAEATYPSTSSDQMAAILPRTTSSLSHEEGEIRDHQETMTEKTSMKQEVMDNNKSKKKKLKTNFRNKGTIVLFTSIESYIYYQVYLNFFILGWTILSRLVNILLNKFWPAIRRIGPLEAKGFSAYYPSSNEIFCSTFRIDHVDLFILNISADLNAPNANLRAEKVSI